MIFFNRLLLSLLMVCLLGGCSTTTVYIVRHAEKVDDTDSTDLSPAGRQRAVALADRLDRRGVAAIFSTPYRRTRQTAQPLANRLNLPIAPYQNAADVANRVGEMRRKSVLVVGHSNTILDIAGKLGITPTRQRIESGDYDNLLMVRIRRGPFTKSVTLSEKTYGVQTAP